jgi:hypothetical protein
MNRRTALAALAAASIAPTLVRADTLPGRTFAPSLPSAPFPHPSRASGHDYNKVHYGVDTSYSDSTVGIYVPAKFRDGASIDAIVHFHGWNNHVAEVFRRYQLREQLEGSGKNAILIVPQGPKDAPDSNDGKLELDQGGLARLLADVLAYLKTQSVTTASAIGKVVLTAHSGGYGGAGGALTRGGVGTITDVILFDSAYGYFDAFADWANASPDHHFLSLFTDDTSFGNTALMAKMQPVRREIRVLDADTMTLAQLQTRMPTFAGTSAVIHDELMQKLDWYELFLKTTALT